MTAALLVSEILPPRIGGSGRMLWEIFSRLPTGTCWILAGTAAEAAAFDATHGIPIERFEMAMPTRGMMYLRDVRRYAGLIRAIRRTVKKHDVKQIHCGRCLPEGFAAWCVKRLLGTPYVPYVHGEDISAAATSRELSWMVRRVLGGAARIVANSRNTQRMLIEDWRVSPDRIIVVTPGIDPVKFTPADPDTNFRDSHGWTGRTVILTVSRLQRRKGQDAMIRALPAIRARFPEVLYSLVGTGEEETSLRALAESEGQGAHVQFLGALSDSEMVKCYQQCDLFALPNRRVDADFEGFGMVLLEAQACGKPVLAGNDGGTPETLINGETGILVDGEQPQSIANTVIELLSNRERMQTMGQRAREWATGFDWATSAGKVHEIVHTV